jgi:hypothetical protein
MNSIGCKFNSLGEDRFNLKVIAKHLREDLKSSVAEFDKMFNMKKSCAFSVSKDRYAITVKIKRIPAIAFNNDIEFNYWKNPRVLLKEEVWKKLEYIGNAYNYDHSEIMTDYFDCNYYFHLEFAENIEII